jgi:DnaJ family protein C protein 13
VVSAMLDILTFALCVPYSETTDGTHFDTLLSLVAKRGRYLFQLFQVIILNFYIMFFEITVNVHSYLQWYVIKF